MGLDLETTGLEAWNDEIDLIALTNERGLQFVLEAAHYTKEQLTELFTLLLSYKCVGQNIKFDVAFIWHHYKVLLTNIHCTMVTAQILENGYQKERDFDLAAIMIRYLGVSHLFADEKSKLQKSFTNKKLRDSLLLLPQVRNKQINYAAADTEHLIALYHKQMEFVYIYSLEKIYKLEHTVLPVLAKMEITGCLIDRVLWKSRIEEFWKPKVAALEKAIDIEVGNLLKPLNVKIDIRRSTTTATIFNLFEAPEEVKIEYDDELNYASPAQLLKLFPLFQEPIPLNGDKKPSVDETTLSVYITEYPDTKLGPLIKLLLEHRQYAKLLSTYGDSFLEKLDRHGRIHTLYTQTTTETGRLSSKAPNLQNLPKPEKGKDYTDIRKCFIARPGYKMVTCDMDAAEVRIAADFSGDMLLIDSLEKGVDMHSKLASVTFSIIFKKPITVSKSEEKITVEDIDYILVDLRDDHKTGLFAKFYKAGGKRMYMVFSEYINAHHAAAKRKTIAQEISDAIDKELPQLSEYLSRLIKEAQTKGRLIANKLGRIRYFKKDVYGEAANMPIQSTNGDAIKIAMVNIDKYLSTIGGYIVLTIHDELVLEVPEDKAEEAALKLKQIMSDALGWFLTRIKGGASVKIAQHWKK